MFSGSTAFPVDRSANDFPTRRVETNLEASPEIRPGRGRLGVEIISGLSAATSSWASSPLKILVPRPRGPSVWAYFSSFGGGLVAGDETSVTLDIGEQTRCFVSTQASTKVYRNPESRPCSHQLEATLAEDSLLAYAPDPIQAFAGSSYAQRQAFHLAPGAGLVLVDWLGSGRAARGERWAFQRFQSRNEIFVDRERVLLDSLLLDPADGPLDSPHRMGRFNCLALVLIIGDLVRDAGVRALEDIAGRPITRAAPLVGSASSVSNGALLRFAGERVEDVAREIHRHLAFLPALLHDDPWSRNW
ncbi:MAG TPA: urease accessory protein UreD [Verrucomicrobiae bacterium]|nr:urease accessory protein UreD [Verrucomicrobiae bacterium]